MNYAIRTSLDVNCPFCNGKLINYYSSNVFRCCQFPIQADTDHCYRVVIKNNEIKYLAISLFIGSPKKLCIFRYYTDISRNSLEINNLLINLQKFILLNSLQEMRTFAMKLLLLA